MAKSTAVAVIPDGFGVIEGPITLPGSTNTPYIQFVSSKSKNYSELLTKCPGVHEGEAVLIEPAPASPTRLNPIEYFLLHGTEFWGTFNKNGELTAMSIERPEYRDVNPFVQVIESVILVVLEDRLVPATARFKATKCPAVYKAIKALDEAKTPEWGRKSADHEFTMKIDKPWARFTTRASHVERNNRTTGEPYDTMEAVVNPTTASQLTKLVAFFQDPVQRKLLDEVQKQYRERLAQIRKKELVPA